VGTVILPIALGAAGVSRLISGHHTPVFIAGAALMVAMGMATLLGWKLPSPCPACRHEPAGVPQRCGPSELSPGWRALVALRCWRA
jgi:hypothetical protein